MVMTNDSITLLYLTVLILWKKYNSNSALGEKYSAEASVAVLWCIYHIALHDTTTTLPSIHQLLVLDLFDLHLAIELSAVYIRPRK
eukprot:scaffold1712_cov165-Ochromonas_danica.AAC.2